MSSSFARMVVLLLLLGGLAPAAANTPRPAVIVPGWIKTLRKKIAKLDAEYPGELGLYVKDLATGEEFSHRGDEPWYLASGVKVPVAVEVLRQIEAGTFTLDTTLTLTEADYVDGAGETNSQAPGSRVTVRFLLEQMLIHSDNTASDLLINLIGLARINESLQQHVPGGFATITSLADVRRHTYSAFHTSATRLTNAQLRLLKAIPDERVKLAELARMLAIPEGEFKTRSLDAAFNAYYAGSLNSAPLRAYGFFLENVVTGKYLNPIHTAYLLGVMERAETGKQRIRAGLPAGYVFAHKTGTQYARFCDFGVVRPLHGPSAKRLVIAACSKGERSLEKAELALKSIGRAIAASGVLE